MIVEATLEDGRSLYVSIQNDGVNGWGDPFVLLDGKTVSGVTLRAENDDEDDEFAPMA